MRVVICVALGALALAGCKKAEAPASAPAAGAAADGGESAAMPKRKAGLWSQTMNVEGAPPMTSRVCLDEATDAKMSIEGQQIANAQCSESKVSKTAAGYSFNSTCQMGPNGTVVVSGVASGDFSSAYKVEASTQISGASNAAMNRTAKMVVAAKYEGPCPADWTPGDVELPGGTRINSVGALEAATK